MTIVYALVSRQKTVLAEFTATLGKSEEKNTTPVEAKPRSRLLSLVRFLSLRGTYHCSTLYVRFV
jgi:hypothetical protein